MYELENADFQVKEAIVVFGREMSAHYFIEVRSFNRVEMVNKPVFYSKRCLSHILHVASSACNAVD